MLPTAIQVSITDLFLMQAALITSVDGRTGVRDRCVAFHRQYAINEGPNVFAKASDKIKDIFVLYFTKLPALLSTITRELPNDCNAEFSSLLGRHSDAFKIAMNDKGVRNGLQSIKQAFDDIDGKWRLKVEYDRGTGNLSQELTVERILALDFGDKVIKIESSSSGSASNEDDDADK